MPRFFHGALPHRIRLHRTVPVLVAAFILPSDRRREHSSIFFSSLKFLAGFTSPFLPQIPIPDTSKIKDKLLGTLPSWTVESAVSKFVKRPQADIIVGISMQMHSLTAFVMYYPKGVDILTDYKITPEAEEYNLRMPNMKMIDDWDVGKELDQPHSVVTPSMRYSSEFPHVPLGSGLKESGVYKLWDPERPDFRVHFSDFFPAQDIPLDKPKPAAFNLTEKQIMTDYARAVRQHIEGFISREIVDDAMIVNDFPIVKWMVLYPDAMDSIETTPGVTVKRNFVSALKDAGFPLDDSDIPPIRQYTPRQDNDEGDDDPVIEDLHTADRMVEFVTAGFASLINLASVVHKSRPVPGLPQEKPFVAVIDDEEFLTARRCVFTANSRFGAMQQQVCAVARSPVFKQFPETIFELVAHIQREMNLFETFDEEGLGKVSNYAIRHWPESKNWEDVIDILARNSDKGTVLLEATGETSWGLEQGTNNPPRITPISAIYFGKTVRNKLYVPTISVFGDIHSSSPEIEDAVLIDTGRGETDAYATIIRGIYYIKEEFQDISDDGADDLIIEPPNLAKLLDRSLEDGTINREDVDEEDEENIRVGSDLRSHLDRARYNRMRVAVAKSNFQEPFTVFGLYDAAALELSRIFLDAHRK